MMECFNGRPGDARGFVHKKLLGAVAGLGIPGISTVATIGRSLIGNGNGGGAAAPAALPSTQAQVDSIIMANVQTASWQNIADMTGQTVAQVQGRYYNTLRSGAPPPPPMGTLATGLIDLPDLFERGRDILTGLGKNGPVATNGCLPGNERRPDRGGGCFPITGMPAGLGEAVMGRFGPALQPGTKTTHFRFCPRGAVLGLDGLCYNRKDIRNTDRWWPRGRRPLLTGGEMRAISIASTAAKKLQRKEKQLRQLGLLKAPPARRRQKLLPPGHTATLEH